MLLITIPAEEYWDELKEEFVIVKEAKTLQLEHSLISLSKWESKWHKSFIHSNEKTYEETLDYIKCMTLTRNVNPEVYDRLTQKNIDEIVEYIHDPMTATRLREERGGKSGRDVVTAELIYYWMISYNIPIEFQKWHLNRLMTLIKVFNMKNQPQKKMSQREIMSRNAALNAARRKQFNSKG